MLENDLRAMFEWEASADQPPAQISFPVVRRSVQLRRRWRRTAAIGSPIVAAAAAVAIGLTGSLVSGTAGPQPGQVSQGSHAAPQRFNPLVPYAAVGWYPYRVSTELGYTFPTALRIIGVGPQDNGARGPGEWTSIVVYTADQCALTASRLSCGSAAIGTSALLTVSGRAPNVGRHAAYWIRRASGDLTPDIPGGEMVAFQYSAHGWAMVTSADAPADVLKIAANLQFGQTARLRFPAQLTALPRSWREVHQIWFLDNGAQVARSLTLTRQPVPALNLPPDSVNLEVSVGKGTPPPCNRQPSCRITTIDGYQVFLTTVPQGRGQPVDYRLNAPNADGLHLEIDITGPNAPLSPAALFAHHLKLLGPDQANWTTSPTSP